VWGGVESVDDEDDVDNFLKQVIWNGVLMHDIDAIVRVMEHGGANRVDDGFASRATSLLIAMGSAFVPSEGRLNRRNMLRRQCNGSIFRCQLLRGAKRVILFTELRTEKACRRRIG